MTTANVAAPAQASADAITWRLVPWLVPYLALCLLGAWRLTVVPDSQTPFGPVLMFYPRSWWFIVALESLPVLVLIPWVWRWLPVHCAIGLCIIMTMACDLLLFSWCMIRVLTPFTLLLMAFFMVKAGFDGWLLCRAIERWDLYLARKAAPWRETAAARSIAEP
jgi:hypothetical protein